MLALIKVRCSPDLCNCTRMTFSQKAGLELDDNIVTPVITFYAGVGDVAKTESILSRFVTGTDKLHPNR